MHDISLILLITYGLAFALLFGAITNRLGLSPIVGYILSGVMVGPGTPGFQADPAMASQLAEIGVILLMFGVGLHFHVEDLMRVKNIAIPGAVFQSLVATLLMLVIGVLMGKSVLSSLLLGAAMSVASTVVLIRVLTDFGFIHTRHGHIAVGWLIVEDLFTVLVLVLLPALKRAIDAGSPSAVMFSLGKTALMVAGLVLVVYLLGRSLVPKAMNYMASTRSRELFTLSVLVVALGFAVGSSELFGVSMALGAFLAGMVVNQSDVSHQAASDALPMRDAFSVLFFVSVGMLLDPMSSIANWGLTLSALAVILIGKPLAALSIVLLLGYPLRSGLIAAMALAQIGEFSFILGEQAHGLGFLSKDATSMLVTCAVITITINPLLFKFLEPLERWIESKPELARRLNARRSSTDELTQLTSHGESDGKAKAVVVGYGPVGQMLTRILRQFEIDPVVVDLNIDTVRRLRSEGVRAIYGDASKQDILHAAEIEKADFFIVTLPGQIAREIIVEEALTLNPDIKTVMRAHYLKEREQLGHFKSVAVAYEELEIAVALAEILLNEIGVDETVLQEKSAEIRWELGMGTSAFTRKNTAH